MVAAVVAAGAFSLVGLVLVWYMVSIEKEGTRGGVIDRVQALLPLQSCKIVIVVWQIVTQASACVFGYCTKYSGGTTTRSMVCSHLAYRRNFFVPRLPYLVTGPSRSPTVSL